MKVWLNLIVSVNHLIKVGRKAIDQWLIVELCFFSLPFRYHSHYAVAPRQPYGRCRSVEMLTKNLLLFEFL